MANVPEHQTRNSSVVSNISSNSEFVVRSSRYNLRNRGPPTFTVLAEPECPICLSDVFEKPVVANCGHTFCGKCIRLSLTKFKNCPICNQVLIQTLFLSDTSYTRKLTLKHRSPARAAYRLAKSMDHGQLLLKDQNRDIGKPEVLSLVKQIRIKQESNFLDGKILEQPSNAKQEPIPGRTGEPRSGLLRRTHL